MSERILLRYSANLSNKRKAGGSYGRAHPQACRSTDEVARASTSDIKEIKTFEELSRIVREEGERNYIHFKVKRKSCLSCCSYFHHFLLLEVIDQNDSNIKVMVAHYTSSGEICTNNSRFGIGKCISQTIEVQKGELNGLFDLKSGLYEVNHQPATHTSRERLYMRLGERAYDFRANNCEHAVNYILKGTSVSNDSNKRACCADLSTITAGDIKEVEIKVALIIALVSSIAGSLTRYSYVRLMIAGVAARSSNMGSNETCSNEKGNIIIRQVKDLLDTHSEIPRFSEIASSEQIIEDIKASFNNPLVCRISGKLAEDAINKTLLLSLLVSISVETVFFLAKIYFTIIPLFKFHKNRVIVRTVLLRGIPGYFLIAIGVLCGSQGQTLFSSPALHFFVFAFSSILVSRFILTVILGALFDLLSKCCKDIENPESTNTNDQINSSNCTCCYKLLRCIALCLIFASLAGIIVPLLIYLD